MCVIGKHFSFSIFFFPHLCDFFSERWQTFWGNRDRFQYLSTNMKTSQRLMGRPKTRRRSEPPRIITHLFTARHQTTVGNAAFFFFYRLTSLTADMFCCPCLLCYCTENGYVQLYIYLGSILDSYNSENIVWLGLGTKITWFRFWKDSWHPREGPVCDPPLMIWFCQKSTHGRS